MRFEYFLIIPGLAFLPPLWHPYSPNWKQCMLVNGVPEQLVGMERGEDLYPGNYRLRGCGGPLWLHISPGNGFNTYRCRACLHSLLTPLPPHPHPHPHPSWQQGTGGRAGSRQGRVGWVGISARWITWGLPSSTLTQIHRKSLCRGPGVISALGAENGVHAVNEGGHISHQSPPHSCYPGLNLTYAATNRVQ